MILIGLDDTDMPDTPGTNQLAKRIVRAASADWRCIRIVRHQLFVDPRVPYTSKNGSASIALEARSTLSWQPLADLCQQMMLDWYVEGSDPGLCITEFVPPEITQFGQRCQQEVVTRMAAQELAESHGLFLKGLGGTCGGVIGALAAVGLAVTEDDGRVVQHGEWPDDLSGPVELDTLDQRDIRVFDLEREAEVTQGVIDVGRHLRPNRRGGRTVLFVKPDCQNAGADYRAVKLT